MRQCPLSQQVKRIVVTSSAAAVVHNSPEPLLLSEKDWNEQSPKEVEELGAKATPLAQYRTSKTLAEKCMASLCQVFAC